MTDLDTLRQALRVPAEDAAAVDISEIIMRGRRLRRRRRAVAIAGGVCAAAAVFGAVTGVTHLTRQAIAPAQQPAGSTRSQPARSPSLSRGPAATASPIPSATGSPIPSAISPAGRATPSWLPPSPSSSPAGPGFTATATPMPS